MGVEGTVCPVARLKTWCAPDNECQTRGCRQGWHGYRARLRHDVISTYTVSTEYT